MSLLIRKEVKNNARIAGLAGSYNKVISVGLSFPRVLLVCNPMDIWMSKALIADM